MMGWWCSVGRAMRAGIGSGGFYATAAARALVSVPDLDLEDVARRCVRSMAGWLAVALLAPARCAWAWAWAWAWAVHGPWAMWRSYHLPPLPPPPSLGSPPPGSRGRGAAAALAGQGSTGRRDQLRACATCVCVGYAGRWAWRRISACTPTTSSRRRSWRRTFRRQRMSRPSREKTARVH
jgi:hypothetical protein